MKNNVFLHTDRSYRLNRLGYFVRTIRHALGKNVGTGEYLRLLLGRLFRVDGALPHMLYVEFSNLCNTRCVYCPCPAYPFEEPFLREDVLAHTIASLTERPVGKLMIGGGEPTLHPRFGEYARRLRPCARFLSVVTNGQWSDADITRTLAEGTFDLVEVSVDAGGKEEYEQTRQGASHDRLLANLRALGRVKRSTGSKTIIGIRLMIRPSTREDERRHVESWKPHCDVIFPQYVSRPAGMAHLEDAFVSVHQTREDYPRCTYPSRAMQIKSDGTVPLCSFLGHAPPESRIILGNIREQDLRMLWRHPVLMQYRDAHRRRDPARMPACRGCLGG